MNTQARFREAILSLTGGASGLYAGRVYAKFVPQDVLGPTWLAIDRIGGTRLAAHDGDGKLSDTSFQVTIGGGKRDEIESVKDFLVENLNGLDYTASEGSIAILLTSEQDQYEPETRAYTAILDFSVLDNNT